MITRKQFLTLLIFAIGQPLFCTDASTPSIEETLLWKHMGDITMEGNFCKSNQTNELCKEVSKGWVEVVKKMPSVASDEHYQSYMERVLLTFDPLIARHICLIKKVKDSFQLLESRNQTLDNYYRGKIWGLFLSGLAHLNSSKLPEKNLNSFKQDSNTLKVWQAAENFYKEVQGLDSTSTDNEPV